MRLLTFVHRSPFATWNSLQAWIRESGEPPEEVVVAHVRRVEGHAATVMQGIVEVLDHYRASDPASRVRSLVVDDYDMRSWRLALNGVLSGDGPWVVDITASRTIAKLAVADLVRGKEDAELFYLDVADYRYEPKPFSWVPYNLQTLWHLTGPEGTPSRRAGARGLRPSPGARPVSQVPGLVRVDAAGHREKVVPWESLLVLLNEAAAEQQAGRSRDRTSFQLKLPAFGVKVAEYDLVSRRFRLEPFDRIASRLQQVRGRIEGRWRAEVPGAGHVLECLATARLLPYRRQLELMDELHAMAAETRGPNPGVAPRAVALDTNLFYFDFVTSLARAAGLPTIRVPVVASSVSRSEIRNQMSKTFNGGALPAELQAACVQRPLSARLAHAAHEEFELLRTRCRMDVIQGHEATASNEENDRRIVMDFAAHRDRERQDLLVISNDRGFIERVGRESALEARHVDFSDPDVAVGREANVDQVAYLVYRLALGFGRVSLKGLGVEVFGEPPQEDPHSYLHEQVVLRVPDGSWSASFLHELELRRRLDAIVQKARLWLP